MGKRSFFLRSKQKKHKYSVLAEGKFLNAKPGGTYTNQQASTRYRQCKLLSLYEVGDRKCVYSRFGVMVMRETQVLKKNLSRCQSVRKKSYLV